jgi:RING finger/CHY zinc finger protein 1
MDFTAVWARHDRMLQFRPMPAIFQHAKVLVLCNDCDQKTESPFHYLGAKCTPCGSYNTTVTGRLNFPSQEEIVAWDEEQRRLEAENPQLAEQAAQEAADLDAELEDMLDAMQGGLEEEEEEEEEEVELQQDSLD